MKENMTQLDLATIKAKAEAATRTSENDFYVKPFLTTRILHDLAESALALIARVEAAENIDPNTTTYRNQLLSVQAALKFVKAEHDAAIARAEKAEAERDELKAHIEGQPIRSTTILEEAASFQRSWWAERTRANALAGENVVLRKALAPFAMAAQVMEGTVFAERADNLAAYSGLCAPSYGELRAARAALQSKDQ